jgi:hypothetical protein
LYSIHSDCGGGKSAFTLILPLSDIRNRLMALLAYGPKLELELFSAAN